jgi:rhomboid protease GluP
MNDNLKRVLESLGINWVWWQWRWIRFKNRLAQVFSTESNLSRYISARQRICRCGALAGSGQIRCEVCGRSLPSATTWFLYRLFGLVLPHVAVATGALSLLILTAFGLMLAMGGFESLLDPPGELLFKMGALFSPAVVRGQWWRLLTCIFLHIGVIHLGFNMMALLSVSSFLEDEVGAARFFCVFMLSGVGGSIATAFLRTFPVLSAGASGALFGLIGFSIVYFHRLGGPHGREVKEFMTRWAIYALVFGFFVGADNFAHVGGLVSGMLLGLIMEQRLETKARREPLWRSLAAVLGIALALAAIMAARFAT